MDRNPNKKTEFVPCIPLEKGYVHGYYEKRDGKMVWISPYENSKDRKPAPGASAYHELEQTSAKLKKPKLDKEQKSKPKPFSPAQMQGEHLNYILDAIIKVVKTITNFENGEIIRLALALKTCRSIISELGYLDGSIEPYFQVPKGKVTRLGKGAARETAAMAKEMKRLMRRITKHTLREKVQKLGEQLEDSL